MDALQQLIYERNCMKAQLKEKYSELNISHLQAEELLNYIIQLENIIKDADENEDEHENLTIILEQKRSQYENLQLMTNMLCMEISLMEINIGDIERSIDKLKRQ